MKKLGIKFQVIPADIDEHHSGFTKPHAIVKSIALRKAEAIALNHQSDWIIGCDTVVILSNGKVSIKPKDLKDAERTIKLYSGKHCDVYSGLAVINKDLGIENVGFEKTRLYFDKISKKDLEGYLKSNEWKDRSGSMTIEGRGGDFVNKIEGCYWNVVGLPVNLLKKFLKQVEK